ncbi:RluA family pseudouridine synthase [Patescibacteria group bacterium]|nr:RluA family pseudouridine synthase [Patescibacteria group bacterium]MBU4580708.1 RluA family pseudouridine synthase [Patescibacteria group bacterium]
MSQNLQFKITLSNQGARLDKFLCGKMPEYSRATIQKMIKEKNILIHTQKTKSSYKIKTGDIIDVKPIIDKIDLSSDPSIKFDIIREEKDFAIISKPAGLIVYPGTKHNEKTLINGLLAVWPEIKNVGDPPVGGLRLRPGIVHRLDKDTSGIMIIAKNNAAFEYFKNLFKNREVEKTYIALAYGTMKPRQGIIDFPIRRSKTNPIKQVAVKEKSLANNARPALTRFSVMRYLKDSQGNEYTLVEAKPETGRMHQIRVHLTAIGHPVVGDQVYKKKENPKLPEVSRQLLHASAIKFISPAGKEVEFNSPLPDDFSEFLKTLKEN